MSQRLNDLHAEFYNPVNRFVRGLLHGSPVAADDHDVTQQVFLRIHDLIEQGRFPTDPEHVHATVIKIAKGKAFNYLRDHGKMVANETATETIFDEIIWESERTDFPVSIDQLSSGLRPKLREVALLLAEGLTHREIGERLEVSELTISKRAQRVMVGLRRAKESFEKAERVAAIPAVVI